MSEKQIDLDRLIVRHGENWLPAHFATCPICAEIRHLREELNYWTPLGEAAFRRLYATGR